MQKLIYLISYIISAANFLGKNQPLEYKILSQEQIQNNTDVHFVSKIEDEGVESVGVGTSSRNVIVKTTKFLVYVNKRNWVLKLKKHLLVGKKNFSAYEETSDANADLQNEITSLNSKIKTLSKEKEISEDFSSRLSKMIGHEQYAQYSSNITAIIEREVIEKRKKDKLING